MSRTFPPYGKSPFVRLALIGLLWLAFGLRAFHLDFQSLWSDEGISLLRGARPLGEMLARMPVEHVPGYFVLLRGWMALTGVTDFGLRYFSLLPSVWAVALIYRLAGDLGSRPIGILAALLSATNGFQIWYAQEVRMYSWLLAAGLLATIACWRLLVRQAGWGVWLLYVLTTTLTIYLHYFGFLVPLSHAAFGLVWLIWQRRDRRVLWRGVGRWALAGLAVAALFAPWFLRALDLLAFEGWREPLDPTRVPWLLLQAYSVGETMPPPLDRWLPWGYAVLALVGLAAWTRCNRVAGWFLGVLLATGLAVVWLLVVRQPDFHVRYPIFISVPLLLLAAGGIAGPAPSWWRREAVWTWQGALLPGLVVIGLLVANQQALMRLYFDRTLHKPDFRGAAQRINAGVTGADTVLIDGPNPALVFAHYYTGDAPVHDLRPLEGAEWAEVDATLTDATAGKARAWELLYFHTPGPVQLWLARNGWATAPSDHNGIRVVVYGLPDGPLRGQPVGVDFGPALHLAQAELDGPRVAAGDLLRVTTTWQVNAAPADYKFSLRVQTPDGQVVMADDYVPQNWFAPTSQWVVGETAVDRRALILPETLPPGRYGVTLRLYDPANGVPVETDAGQDVLLGEVDVVAAGEERE